MQWDESKGDRARCRRGRRHTSHVSSGVIVIGHAAATMALRVGEAAQGQKAASRVSQRQAAGRCMGVRRLAGYELSGRPRAAHRAALAFSSTLYSGQPAAAMGLCP